MRCLPVVAVARAHTGLLARSGAARTPLEDADAREEPAELLVPLVVRRAARDDRASVGAQRPLVDASVQRLAAEVVARRDVAGPRGRGGTARRSVGEVAFREAPACLLAGRVACSEAGAASLGVGILLRSVACDERLLPADAFACSYAARPPAWNGAAKHFEGDAVARRLPPVRLCKKSLTQPLVMTSSVSASSCSPSVATGATSSVKSLLARPPHGGTAPLGTSWRSQSPATASNRWHGTRGNAPR